jgi:YebC/PmpR family DNA-binding regulatory protein
MSGHSHWASIKHKKGAVDAKKGKVFSKLAKNIASAARHGGGDPDMNLKLKYAIEKARAANMPKDNIERCIKKGTGEIPGEHYEEGTYEAIGPGGVAMLIEILTDNRNRTAAEIRKLLETRGGRLGQTGSVAWQFERKGLFLVDSKNCDEDKLMEAVLDAGADDIRNDNGIFEVICAPENFEKVKTALFDNRIKTESGELSRVPKQYIDLDEATARRIMAIVEELEDHEDVQNVYSNFNLPDTVLAELKVADGA